MAAVKAAVRSIDGHFEVGRPASAEVHLHAMTLMDWSVAENPGIGMEQIGVLVEKGLKMRRAGFFLALEEKSQIHRDRSVSSRQCVERGHKANYGCLVVAGRARIQAPFRIKISRRRHRIDRRLSGAQGPAAKDWSPWTGLPLGWIDRLAVVVRVERDG